MKGTDVLSLLAASAARAVGPLAAVVAVVGPSPASAQVVAARRRHLRRVGGRPELRRESEIDFLRGLEVTAMSLPSDADAPFADDSPAAADPTASVVQALTDLIPAEAAACAGADRLEVVLKEFVDSSLGALQKLVPTGDARPGLDQLMDRVIVELSRVVGGAIDIVAFATFVIQEMALTQDQGRAVAGDLAGAFATALSGLPESMPACLEAIDYDEMVSKMDGDKMTNASFEILAGTLAAAIPGFAMSAGALRAAAGQVFGFLTSILALRSTLNRIAKDILGIPSGLPDGGGPPGQDPGFDPPGRQSASAGGTPGDSPGQAPGQAPGGDSSRDDGPPGQAPVYPEDILVEVDPDATLGDLFEVYAEIVDAVLSGVDAARSSVPPLSLDMTVADLVGANTRVANDMGDEISKAFVGATIQSAVKPGVLEDADADEVEMRDRAADLLDPIVAGAWQKVLTVAVAPMLEVIYSPRDDRDPSDADESAADDDPNLVAVKLFQATFPLYLAAERMSGGAYHLEESEMIGSVKGFIEFAFEAMETLRPSEGKFDALRDMDPNATTAAEVLAALSEAASGIVSDAIAQSFVGFISEALQAVPAAGEAQRVGPSTTVGELVDIVAEAFSGSEVSNKGETTWNIDGAQHKVAIEASEGSMSMPTPLDADADALEMSAAAYAAQEVVQALDAVLPNEVQACVGLSDFEPIVESIIADAAEAFQTLTDYGTSIVETIIADTAEASQTLTEDGASTASDEDEGLGELAEELSDTLGEIVEQVKDVADALGEFIQVNGMAPIVDAVAIVVQGATPDEEEDSAVAVVLKDVKGRISEAIANRLETAGCLRDIDVAQMIWGSASDFDWDETYLGKARASILDAILPEARY